MLKKSIIALFVLAALGTAVAPQAEAQDIKRLEALEKELEQLEAKVDKGQQLTPKEARRMQEIRDEVMKEMAESPYGDLIRQHQPPQGNIGANDGNRQLQQIQQMQQKALQQQQQIQQQPRQQQTQQGANAGWPPALAFQSRFKIPPLAQPAGTTARYDSYQDNEVVQSLEIYLTGGNTALQNLKQQVEKVIGKQMSAEGGEYFGFIDDPNYKAGGHIDHNIRFWLRIENNNVVLTIHPVAG
ncbi:MAG: hypothetical protein LBU73_04555 [Helicobacteraceae bacterium]|jgi:hypothetical protein|nr:hypothetical protein [Helicobacteraceae bacterium]